MLRRTNNVEALTRLLLYKAADDRSTMANMI